MSLFAGCALLTLVICLAAAAHAGDGDVDYSAPYVTLEDGVLVTRYPTTPHDPATDPPGSAITTTEVDDTMPDDLVSPIVPLLMLMFLALIMTWTILRRRKTN